MEITIEELNILLQKEFERGKYSTKPSIEKSLEFYKKLGDYLNEPIIPDACKLCPNHTSNGGSGICNCLLGDTTTYSTNTIKKD